MTEEKTFLLLKYGSMARAVEAYNASDDRDTDFDFEAQCLIEGYAMAHGLVIKMVYGQNTLNPLTL